MEAAKTLNGGCLCGEVRFTAAPENHNYGACQCDTCHKWSAGPFLALDCGGSFKVEDDSDLSVFKSSEWAERGFCSKCGSSLYYKISGKDYVVVSTDAFDDASDFIFDHQVFIDEKPGHYSFANKTKNMTGAEVFAAYGSSDSEGA